jgi:hypothetical protein
MRLVSIQCYIGIVHGTSDNIAHVVWNAANNGITVQYIFQELLNWFGNDVYTI